jgi:hypothetical protein
MCLDWGGRYVNVFFGLACVGMNPGPGLFWGSYFWLQGLLFPSYRRMGRWLIWLFVGGRLNNFQNWVRVRGYGYCYHMDPSYTALLQRRKSLNCLCLHFDGSPSSIRHQTSPPAVVSSCLPLTLARPQPRPLSNIRKTTFFKNRTPLRAPRVSISAPLVMAESFHKWK